MKDYVETIEDGLISAFTENYPQNSPHYWLACHAAIPSALTSDLLYKIWLNFNISEGPVPEKLDIPLAAVGDILNSPICKKIGLDLYEIRPSIRSYLTDELINNEEIFGHKRVKKIAKFLRAYVEFCNDKIPTNVLKESLLMVSDSYLDPAKAAKKIVDYFNDSQKEGGTFTKVNISLNWISNRQKVITKHTGKASNDPLLIIEKFIKAIQLLQSQFPEKGKKLIESIKDSISKISAESNSLRAFLPIDVIEKLDLEIKEISDRETELQNDNTANTYLPFSNSLILMQLTEDAPLEVKLSPVESMADVFKLFKPSVEVDLIDQEGDSIQANYPIETIDDFTSKGIVNKINFLNGVNRMKLGLERLKDKLKGDNDFTENYAKEKDFLSYHFKEKYSLFTGQAESIQRREQLVNQDVIDDKKQERTEQNYKGERKRNKKISSKKDFGQNYLFVIGIDEYEEFPQTLQCCKGG
jgi:hypothetical protein